MKILDKVSVKQMLSRREKCNKCLGRGYELVVLPFLDARKFRGVRPCSCVWQIVRIEED